MATKATLRIQAKDSKPVQFTNPGAAIPSRTMVLLVSGLIGVAQCDIGATGVTDGSNVQVLHTAGVYEVPKNAGISFVAGEAVFWDSGNNRVDKAGTAGAIYLGIAYKSAANADAVMWVDFNARPTWNFTTVTISAGQDAANAGNGQLDIVTGQAVAPKAVFVTVIDTATKVMNTGYVLDIAAVAGTITIKGVAAGIQLDQNDIAMVAWIS